jgi:hypothetical protein
MKYLRTLICLLNPVALWYFLQDKSIRCWICGRIASGGFHSDKGWICSSCEG